MKKAFFLLLFAALSGRCSANDDMTRLGVTFLGTGFLSLSIERHFGDNSVRVRAGVFEMQEICTAFMVNHYFTDSDTKPYAGIGLWNVHIFPEWKYGRLDILNVPVGLDWNVKDRHFAGAELDVNYFLTGKNPGGGKVTFNEERRFLPLPALYYKYRI